MAKLTTIGIDLAKNEFALYGLGPKGQCGWKCKVRRKQLLNRLAKLAPCTVAMEACGSSHYWARTIQAQGHTVVLLPPQHVKGYLRGQKNDYNDAQAIAEACEHGRIRPVPIKSVEQQDEQMLHKLRRSVSNERTRMSNRLRGLLAEYGVIIPKGIAALRRELPLALEDAENELSTWARQLLNRQYRRFLEVEQELAWYDQEVERQAKADEVCQRLDELPGVGLMVASVLKGWMGDGQQFQRGRDAAAALGLVPRQNSTGGKEVLLGISKRGDPYVRAQLVHGARAVVSRVDQKSDQLSRWIQRIKAQRGVNKATVALANKLVRMAWVIIARGERYRPLEERMAE
ncbi:IS110 family transposase [Marinimicrobium locisalis]|uniref:IS110 family transposase n=1 Tax=Marinimicrobium locisalis TaxID=546022 RepID=UPI0032217C2C